MQQSLTSREKQFTALYQQSFDYVYAYILARTAGDRQMAEDIVQETFISAWSSLDRFRRESSWRTWVCSIAHNKLKESYRRAIRREKLEFPDEELLDAAQDQLDLELTVLSSAMRIRVSQALNCMNVLYRYALVMKYMDDMSVKEIAKALGRSNKATDGILQRAKASFQKNYSTLERAGAENE